MRSRPFLALLALTACVPAAGTLTPGSSPSTDDIPPPTTPADTGSTASPSDTGPTPTPTPPGCTSHEVPRQLEVTLDGEIRTALLAGPTDLPTSPIPLILNFHGYSDGAEAQEGYALMSDHAPGAGYVVAYPQGTGLLAGWNAGACCGTAASSNVDDVAFTQALIDAIADVACVDIERVYAVGYSNGGFFSHKLACEQSEHFAGIASVAGVVGIDTCAPGRPIPVLQIHGTSDLIVPYGGNAFLGYPSVDDTMEGWRVRNGCSDSTVVSYAQGDATCVAWEDCDQPVALCTLDGGGHTWPGGTAPAIRGEVSTDLDATAGMWQFFLDASAGSPLR